MPTTAPATVTGSATRLLARLTLDQKIAMLHQHAPAIEALGLARFHTGAEAAHGVAWLGPATVFPQPVGLAASWDEDLIRRVGTAVGMEVRGKKAEDPGVSVNVWAPVVNPLRHPLWGRNEEGFSEDPHLTAALAGAYCAGLKGNHERFWLTVPTLKHFLAYNNETDRNVSSSQLRARVLHEYELPAYRGPVEDGVAGAVMLSYNLVNGRPAHVSDLVAGELRQWRNGGDITIVTDAGAPSSLYTAEKYFDDGASAYAAALRAGVDSFTEDSDNPEPALRHLKDALDRGLISEVDIDRAVGRLLALRERTGEFEPDGGPYGSVGPELVGLPAHVELAREAARKSVVLLRNGPAAGAEGPLLPLGSSPGTIAVIGALGSTVLSDWYSGTLQNAVSIADGLSSRYGDVVATEAGVDQVTLRCVRTNTYLGSADPATSMTASATAPGPAETFQLKDWGAGECTLQSPATGKFVAANGYYLAASADRVGGWVVQETFRLHPGADGTVSIQHIGSGKWLRIEEHTGSAALAAGTAEAADRFQLRTVRSGQQAAREAAAAADVAVVVVGNDPHLGGRETLDRSTLALPQQEQELIRLVREANPRTVLVIVSSYPYALGPLADTPAVLWTSHGGQELGNGVADILSGGFEPTGRLAQTWWARDEDLPDIFDYDLIASKGTYLYSDAEPMFPLGHGLGYSTVHYESVVLAHGVLEVAVRNSGTRTAHELVQVYAASPGHRFQFPRRLLVAHRRVELAPGERRTVRIPVPLDRLATYSVIERRMLVEPGTYELMVGPSAGKLPLGVELSMTGEGSGPRRRGAWIRAELFDECSNLALVPQTPLAGTAVAPSSPQESATAVYRGWEGGTPEQVALRLTAGAGVGRVAVQLPGRGGTWTDSAEATVDPGFDGELALLLDGLRHAVGGGGAESVRIVLAGPLTVSELQVT